MVHFFYECPVSRKVLDVFFELCDSNHIEVNLDCWNFISNNIHKSNPAHIVNYVGIITKQYLYRLRWKGLKPTRMGYIVNLEVAHDIEYANAKKEKCIEKHCKKRSHIFEYDHC